MHVSLPRRSPRFGLSLQYLLWICFGLLAVVPWQIICGQDEIPNRRIEKEEDWFSEPDQTASNKTSTVKSKRIKTSKPNPFDETGSPSLIFRSQSEMPPSGPIPQPGSTQADPPTFGGILDNDQLTGRSGKAYGTQFRASFLTGPAIGRQHDIIPLEMMPYAFLDNTVFFADIRGFATTNPSNGGFGGNFGGGVRQYFPRFDRILGVNAYYDYDTTSGATFREVGFGAESLGALYDVRANAYLPTGQSNQQLSLTNINGTQVFSGHNLLVDQAKVVADALRGFDAEIGVPLPGRIAMRHDIRLFGGGYYFQGDQISTFGGWKIKGQAKVTPNISLNLQVSHDPQFNTNVVFGASWSFGGYRQGDDEVKTQYSRMTDQVQRQYNMVVGLTTQVLKGVTVINPATNNPYFFEHVSDNATHPVATPADNGTVEHPFLTLADAQAVALPNDIIFVHGNSSYTGTAVTLQSNIRVLGEATNIEHQVNTSAGLLTLPHPTASPAVRPIFANSPTDGVTLANNSEFSGFQINSPAGFGIIGNGVSNVTVRQTDVTSSGNSGVFLNATGGTINMQGDVINDPTTNATTFLVTGTTGTVNFTSDPLSDLKNATGGAANTPGIVNNVNGTGGMVLEVNNTVAGSIVNFTGSTLNDTTGNGILITQDAGVVEVGDVNVTNGLGIGLDILNNSGAVFGNGTIDITNSTGDSIVIQGTSAGGNVFFTDPGTAGTGANPAGINITGRKARGIFIDGNAGNITFLTPTSIAATGTVAESAIDFQGNSGNAVFNNTIKINGGGPGITIGNALGVPAANTGQFTVNSNTTITNTTGIGIDVVNDQSVVTFNGGAAHTLLIDQRGNIGIQVLNEQGGSVTFGGTATVNNQNAITLPAVDIRGNQAANASVTFNTLSIENAAGPTIAPFSGIGLNIGGTAAADFNTDSVTINTLNIGDVGVANGNNSTFAALAVNHEGTNTTGALKGLTIGNGTINSINGPAIDIENSTMRVILGSVSSNGSPTNGITLINDQSFTLLTNNVTAPLLNDYMFQILGSANALLRNGGIIQNSVNDGIFISQTNANLFQTGDVSLNQIQLAANTQGLVASGLLQLQMTNSEINNSVHDGLLGTNIPLVNIFTSYFNLNGTVIADNAIHLTANTTLLTTNRTAGGYDWNIENNNTTSAGIAAGFFGGTGAGNIVQVDSGGQTLKVQTTSTLTTVTPLVFNFLNNSVLMQAGPARAAGATTVTEVAAVAVNWTGFESGSINENTFILNGNNQAVSFINIDPTYLTNFFVLGNSVTANNGGNIGIFVNNFGPTDLQIGTLLIDGVNIQNTFTFNTPNTVNGGVTTADIGMQFSVLNSTTTTSLLSLTDNIITMTGQAADQGVVFTLLQGASPGQTTVNLSNNNISVNTAPNAPINGQGIDFQTILGTINLEGALSNTVTINGTNAIPNAAGVTTADWVILPAAANTRTGQFFVNGLVVR